VKLKSTHHRRPKQGVFISLIKATDAKRLFHAAYCRVRRLLLQATSRQSYRGIENMYCTRTALGGIVVEFEKVHTSKNKCVQ
jgi:hypothetical protein